MVANYKNKFPSRFVDTLCNDCNPVMACLCAFHGMMGTDCSYHHEVQ